MSFIPTVSLFNLESHLWESANILRGPVDAADFKAYILPLLFFKRICDVWDDEYQEIVDETGDEQLAWFPESHRFQISEGSHWNDVRTKANNVGAAMQRAMREIEKANPDTLYGVQRRSWPTPDGGPVDRIAQVIDTLKSNPIRRPIGDAPPPFPLATDTLAPLKAGAKALGRDDFSTLWLRKDATGCCDMLAADVTRLLAGV